MLEKQHKSSNCASKKEEGKDPTLSEIAEDLSSYFKEFSQFKKYEKDIKRKYKKYYNTTLPDRWPVEFINKAWRKTTKHMYTFSARRKCWSLAILLQVMKRSQGYDESQREETQSDLKEDNQQSGGDPSAVYIRIPFAEMTDNKKCSSSDNPQNENTHKLIDKVPSPTQMLQNNFYITLYDNQTRNAAWVYEILNKSTLAINVHRYQNLKFKRDASVHPLFQAPEGENSYKDKRYNHGHLAARANHRWCQKAYEDTYLLSNVVPQQRDFNKGPWSNLEELCRKIAQKDEVRNVHVYTGPLYLPSDNKKDNNNKYKFLGGKAVPTHLFKVIIVENNDGKVLKPECYKMPNKKEPVTSVTHQKGPFEVKVTTITDKLAYDIECYEKTLKPYNVSIEEIQRDSGLIFEEREIREKMKDKTWKVQWKETQENPNAQERVTEIEIKVSGS
ncbi:nuclease EXOG, mitochondrial-like isoform X2 [Megalobrama amblycephala]|uniref:nuclease EXOG, mitochondrial-like isoform X2 n=1 Tax=Megalobrama amblycephala TaxID=75352 RepID=UPI0020142E1D|nr:nuclease EXOG, mitochondrial-like isoform X2 [Megalobrama amblycephala]